MSIKINDNENKTYIVLGAPHSATSFISKMLEENGVEMHNSKTEKYEPYYEDPDFIYLNRRILYNAKGSLGKPPSENNLFKVDVKNRIKNLIKKKKSKFWGFKDPRTALTFNKYLPHLDGDVYLICCFRKPERTFKSYCRENGQIPPNLIASYNKAIISAISKFCEF